MREKAQLTTASVTEGDPAALDFDAEAPAEVEIETGRDAKQAAEVTACGVEDFWLTVLKNVDLTAEMIQRCV